MSNAGAKTERGTAKVLENIVGNAFHELISHILEISRLELEKELRSQLINTPSAIIDDEDPFILNRQSYLDDEDEVDPEELFDAPDVETSIETGEGAEREPTDPHDEAETLLQYAERKLESDFQTLDDGEKRKITALLDQWLRSGRPPSLTSITKLPKELRLWFEHLLNEFTGLDPSEHIETTPCEADIIFYMRGNEIKYDINLGLLDRCRLNGLEKSRKLLTIGKRSCALGVLSSLAAARREGLVLLAEFLIREQAPSIKAVSLSVAMDRLRSLKKKQFIDDILLRQGVEKRKEWGSRVINNKWVLIPCCNEPIPATIFFDELIGRFNVLKKTIDLKKTMEFGTLRKMPVLTALDQEVVLKALCAGKTSGENIRKTFWPLLQKLYPEGEERWKELGIVGNKGRIADSKRISDCDLAELINQVRNELELPYKEFSIKDLRRQDKEANRSAQGKMSK